MGPRAGARCHPERGGMTSCINEGVGVLADSLLVCWQPGSHTSSQEKRRADPDAGAGFDGELGCRVPADCPLGLPSPGCDSTAPGSIVRPRSSACEGTEPRSPLS